MASPMSYLQQIPGQISPYYQPFINAGTGAMSNLEGQYGDLINNPGAKFNQMGESFQQSPGFNWQMQQALQGANHAAAAGGMAGSPEHEQNNEQVANDLANQDYYNYMDHVTGLYGEGLHGEQDLMHQGYNATTSLTDQIAQMLSQEARMQYGTEMGKKSAQSSIFGDIAQGAATGAGYALML
jgi:hypothetical protein